MRLPRTTGGGRRPASWFVVLLLSGAAVAGCGGTAMNAEARRYFATYRQGCGILVDQARVFTAPGYPRSFARGSKDPDVAATRIAAGQRRVLGRSRAAFRLLADADDRNTTYGGFQIDATRIYTLLIDEFDDVRRRLRRVDSAASYRAALRHVRTRLVALGRTRVPRPDEATFRALIEHAPECAGLLDGSISTAPPSLTLASVEPPATA